MRCMHINIRKATFILLTLLINRIQMEDQTRSSTEIENKKNESPNINFKKKNDVILNCPTNSECKNLKGSCIKCDLKEKCIYGETLRTTCEPEQGVTCTGPISFPREYICRYCYQTDHWEHECELSANCNSVTSPPSYYVTNCTVKDDIICLGLRSFKKKLVCNWTCGYRWSTTLLLSITLGGFGADRFYLGHWQEGIGKLFSFGGLGVWTIIDVILISLHYLGPADGSLYI
ncbi:TM2 domain-containing protein almondex isoform X1 [Diorhabda carinulata]|uniref:TM2 domain-containing protein almondex isoform X1 n=1 Tax=Diorhabda carinulata TaxID=1163345 RepID=UPI0025A05FA0|nr:TM2 domain-containing protein almondex isoform X1 [Diorhabda carinulata]